MTAPVLSVIIANYNNEKYLADCLDSVLNQTYKNLEILVCDDYSTDQSLSLLKEYEKRHPSMVRILSNDSNMGVTPTRHKAILHAKGEYLTTLDSDDYYCEIKKLQREMDLVLKNKSESSKDVIGFSNIILVNGDKTLIRVCGDSSNIKEGQIINEMITRSCMIPRDFIMKRNIYFEVGGFDVDIPIYEDWDLKIRLANRCDFYFSGVNGTAYRRHGKGLSSAHVSEHIKWMQKIFQKNLALIADDAKDRVRRQFNQFIAER